MSKIFSFKSSCCMAIALSAFVLIGGVFSPARSALPDTGITKCYNDTAEIPCPSPGQDFYGQDGNYNINPPSYTKLDARGIALPDSAISWVMVKDNVTGLIWEVKTTDGSIHDSNKTYDWLNAVQYNFIIQLNTEHFGGHYDWRLPSREELRSIMDYRDYSRYNSAINTGYFPNIKTFQDHAYWSSSTYAYAYSSSAWAVYFFRGDSDVVPLNKSSDDYAFAVRGGSVGSSDNWVINNDGTVTDKSNGLMWQQTTGNDGIEMTWKAALAYCENLNFAGYTDWRLPNIKELASLVDLNRYNPAIDPKFSDTKQSVYWSSSTDTGYTFYAWGVSFYGGGDSYGFTKSNSWYARCVRGGDLFISGYVRDSGNNGIAGVTMMFSNGDTVTTDYFGFYTKSVSSGWSGTVTPSKSGAFSPANRSYSNVTTNQADQDYIIGIIKIHLPDTGQTKCYNDTVEIQCPSQGQDFYGQDGNYTINPPSYTKLDANGNALPDSAISWAMVKDNVTGLIWEVKTTDGSIHDSSKTYTWADAQNVFIAQLNVSKFGDYNDWRLPTQQELHSIVDYSQDNPAIDMGYFPNINTNWSGYWSSSTGANSTGSDIYQHAWCMDFYYGYSTGNDKDDKSYNSYVLAVRGGSVGSSDNLVSNNDGTVTDKSTGLMWQQATGNDGAAMTWKAALAYCENLNFAGHTDWRQPNIRELASLADLSRYKPAIDARYFPDTKSDNYYWSSSTAVGDTSRAWGVRFDYGSYGGWNYYDYTKSSNSWYVRCLRGGDLFISGYVRDSGNTGIAGVTMTFNNGDTVTTDNSGFYTKSITSGWNGTVMPSKSGYIFTPANKTYSNVTANQVDQNYTGIAETRIIALTGNLAFGDVATGQTATQTLTISNTGNSPLTVSSIDYPPGFSDNRSGTITVPAGGSQNVTVTFTPTAAQSYSGGNV